MISGVFGTLSIHPGNSGKNVFVELLDFRPLSMPKLLLGQPWKLNFKKKPYKCLKAPYFRKNPHMMTLHTDAEWSGAHCSAQYARKTVSFLSTLHPPPSPVGGLPSAGP